jgi:hypothetical protein
LIKILFVTLVAARLFKESVDGTCRVGVGMPIKEGYEGCGLVTFAFFFGGGSRLTISINNPLFLFFLFVTFCTFHILDLR